MHETQDAVGPPLFAPRETSKDSGRTGSHRPRVTSRPSPMLASPKLVVQGQFGRWAAGWQQLDGWGLGIEPGLGLGLWWLQTKLQRKPQKLQDEVTVPVPDPLVL